MTGTCRREENCWALTSTQDSCAFCSSLSLPGVGALEAEL